MHKGGHCAVDVPKLEPDPELVIEGRGTQSWAPVLVGVPELEPDPEPVLEGRGTESWVPVLVPPVEVAFLDAKGFTLLPPLAALKSQSKLP